MVGGGFGIESVGVSFDDGDSSLDDGYQAVVEEDDEVLRDHRLPGHHDSSLDDEVLRESVGVSFEDGDSSLDDGYQAVVEGDD